MQSSHGWKSGTNFESAQGHNWDIKITTEDGLIEIQNQIIVPLWKL